MSVVNNIQGTLTQTQQPSQVQQQQGEQAKVQQEQGEVLQRQEVETKKNSVSKQEDAKFAKLSNDSKEKDNRKSKNKKKTLEDSNNQPPVPGSMMFGGGLIDTQA
jgi:hypothetical protein